MQSIKYHPPDLPIQADLFIPDIGLHLEVMIENFEWYHFP